MATKSTCTKVLTVRGFLVRFSGPPEKSAPPEFCHRHPWITDISRISKKLVANPIGQVGRSWLINGERCDTPNPENNDAEDTETDVLP